ncbi:MAG: hypothetical protein HKN23_14635, partial [Verrucomicrobiales bacterium]|nr:hypothetical protein [Verrucomicrobiales bacterium]
MNLRLIFILSVFLVCADFLPAQGGQPDLTPRKITLATYPALSPDGSQVAFAWAGDIWIARTRGGRARRLTGHAGYENGPVFSPDGKEIGFTRLEKGKEQVFVVPVRGGIPRQVTFHSEGSRILGFYPEGKSILISAIRDFGTRSATRFYRVRIDERKAEKLLFDAEGVRAALSPNGKKLLFTREGYDLYRKGYRGTKASQIWLAENLETPEPKFT